MTDVTYLLASHLMTVRNVSVHGCVLHCDRKKVQRYKCAARGVPISISALRWHAWLCPLFITEAHSVVKVWCVCVSLRLALLLVLAGCHSGSSFLACSFRAESYPWGNSHGQTECFAHSFFPLPSFFLCFLFLSLQVSISTVIFYWAASYLTHSVHMQNHFHAPIRYPLGDSL